MTDSISYETSARNLLAARNLRRRIGVTAAAIAVTEELIADTLDRLARSRPQHTARLRAKAEHARLFAAHERGQAAIYGSPCANTTPADGEGTSRPRQTISSLGD